MSTCKRLAKSWVNKRGEIYFNMHYGPGLDDEWSNKSNNCLFRTCSLLPRPDFQSIWTNIGRFAQNNHRLTRPRVPSGWESRWKAGHQFPGNTFVLQSILAVSRTRKWWLRFSRSLFIHSCYSSVRAFWVSCLSMDCLEEVGGKLDRTLVVFCA